MDFYLFPELFPKRCVGSTVEGGLPRFIVSSVLFAVFAELCSALSTNLDFASALLLARKVRPLLKNLEP
jgi:hypothetical protein